MATYTITAVSPTVRDWSSSQGGAMKEYKVHMRDAQGQFHQSVEWSRKESSPAPTVGQEIEGEITDGKYGQKFKAAASAGRLGGGGWRPRDPAERRSIAMQHAQKCAVTILEVAAAHGDYKPPNAGDVAGHVKTIAATLFQQVQEAEAGS